MRTVEEIRGDGHGITETAEVTYGEYEMLFEYFSDRAGKLCDAIETYNKHVDIGEAHFLSDYSVPCSYELDKVPKTFHGLRKENVYTNHFTTVGCPSLRFDKHVVECISVQEDGYGESEGLSLGLKCTYTRHRVGRCPAKVRGVSR